VGMTGSGKTGLCVVMLEELVRAGVPVIAIDPKGDLGNLALLFPEQSAQAFAPWVEPGADPQQTASTWKKGLAGYGIDSARIAALKDALDLTLYTPGSEAGTPVDVLGAFRRPPGAADAQPDVLRALVAVGLDGPGRARQRPGARPGSCRAQPHPGVGLGRGRGPGSPDPDPASGRPTLRKGRRVPGGPLLPLGRPHGPGHAPQWGGRFAQLRGLDEGGQPGHRPDAGRSRWPAGC
ncbi:MAG: ATP-binding protein, partial [Oligoflexia bacterium]|nr:ATP-binding protein [Oligoflexia bacterium]